MKLKNVLIVVENIEEAKSFIMICLDLKQCWTMREI